MFEDYKSKQTGLVLFLNAPMLKMASEIYTRRIYEDFEKVY